MFTLNKITKLSIILFVTAISISFCNIASAEFKFAVIDTQKVFEEYKKAKEANAVIEKAVNRLKNEIDGARKELKDMQERLTKQKLFLDDSEKLSQMQDGILTKKQEIQGQIQTGQKAIEEKRQELAEPILKEIDELVKQIGKKQGYSMILEKRLVTLYVDPKYDLTDYVVKRLNSKYEKEKSQKNQKKEATKSNKNKEKKNEK